MGKLLAASIVLAACGIATSAHAKAALEFDAGAGSTANELRPYLQCVPYARSVSGIQIYGDAYTWWDQADGRYSRGKTPRKGAVMAFRPYGNMKLGHVAAVSRVLDSRTVLLRHANWSPIGGERGQIEDDVRAVDVSSANDWSQVRVWYAPIDDLGTTAWPVEGFIYPERAAKREAATLARADTLPSPAPIPALAAAPTRNAQVALSAPARPVRRDIVGAIIRGEYRQ